MEVSCVAQGTIYYNPNTFVITQASGPSILSKTASEAFVDYVNTIPSKTINTYSVTFRVCFDVIRLGVEDFGRFDQSFTVSP